MLRHTIEALVNPVCLIFFLLLILAVIHRSRMMGLAAFILWLAGSGLIPSWLTQQLESPYHVVKQIDPAIKWVVVLSGGQADNPEKLPASQILYSASIKRLLEGVRLYRLQPELKLLLSGGGYGQSIPEADGLYQVAKMCGIPKQALFKERQSLNTSGQAKALKPWVKHRPFYLVTSAIHMKRALYLCQQQGLNPIPAPTDFTFYWNDERWQKYWLPNGHNLMYTSIASHELLGIIWARLLAFKLQFFS